MKSRIEDVIRGKLILCRVHIRMFVHKKSVGRGEKIISKKNSKQKKTVINLAERRHARIQHKREFTFEEHHRQIRERST